MTRGVIPHLSAGLRPSCASPRRDDLRGARDVEVLQRRRNGTGACGAVTISIGAFSAPKAFCATCAETSAAMLQRGLASSTQTRRPVFSTLSITVSMSSGLSGAQVDHLASTPFLASVAAASSARCTIGP